MAMTIGELYGPAMLITEQAEANEYFKYIVEHIMLNSCEGKTYDLKTAQDIARKNLGYYAGYYDHETRLRVEKLFSCSHPVFGSAAGGTPSLEEAFVSGVVIGISTRV